MKVGPIIFIRIIDIICMMIMMYMERMNDMARRNGKRFNKPEGPCPFKLDQHVDVEGEGPGRITSLANYASLGEIEVRIDAGQDIVAASYLQVTAITTNEKR